jgi:hypothetical protein
VHEGFSFSIAFAHHSWLLDSFLRVQTRALRQDIPIIGSRWCTNAPEWHCHDPPPSEFVDQGEHQGAWEVAHHSDPIQRIKRTSHSLPNLSIPLFQSTHDIYIFHTPNFYPVGKYSILQCYQDYAYPLWYLFFKKKNICELWIMYSYILLIALSDIGRHSNSRSLYSLLYWYPLMSHCLKTHFFSWFEKN